MIGLKKELSRLALQIYTMNEILGRKNNAVMALLNLQSRGVTEDQILNVYKFFEEYGRVTPSGFEQAQNAPNNNAFFDTKKWKEGGGYFSIR
jgi:hypothetical protein